MKTQAAEKICLHCGTPFRPTGQYRDFCCGGCQFVHKLIVTNGLGQFYDLQDGALPPAPNTVFQPREYAWLEALATASPGKPLTLELQGLSCVGCVWLIERLFTRRNGALAIRIDSSLGRMTIHAAAEFDYASFAKELQNFGYLVGPPTTATRSVSRALLLRLGICGALAMNAMLFTLPSYLGMQPDAQFARLFSTLAFVCGTLSFAIGGSYFITRAFHSLRHRVLHIDLPIGLGIITAWIGSVIAWRADQAGFVYFDFVSTFTFLMLGGRWLQQKAVEANRSRLLTTEPDLVRPDLGEHYRVAPGATVPVRSMLHSPEASVSFESINGEADAQSMRAGQTLAAGAINLTSREILCEALEPWSDSLLSRLVEETRREPARDIRLERFLRIYLGVVLTLAGVAFLGWYFVSGDILRALQVLTSILVVSCPCAAGVALPLADELAAARVQTRGLFIRERDLWSRLLRLRRVVFDKTGTLTLQGMQLTNPAALDSLSPEHREVLLAMVRQNLHPVASALRETLMAQAVRPAELVSEIVEHIGFGLEVEHEGCCWSLGRSSWIGSRRGPDCVFARDGEVLAEFSFHEAARADAQAAIDHFSRKRILVTILSGDRPEKVSRLAKALRIPEHQALGGLSPDAKADWVRAHDPAHILMIGDGANDSLAFNEAGCTGTPVIDRGILEQKADFYFLGRSLSGLCALLDTASARAHATRLVLGFAIGYNAIAVALSAAGHMSPLVAAVIMPASSLATIGLALFAFRQGRSLSKD